MVRDNYVGQFVSGFVRAAQSLHPAASRRRADFESALDKQRSGDYQAAFDAWETWVARWPKDVGGLCCLAACAREIGRLDYACDIVERAVRLFPRHASVIAEAALNEQRKGRWELSAACWERIVHTRSAHAVWCHCYVLSLLTLGRLDEADALWKTWRRRFPEQHGLALQAMIASARKDFDEALSLWSAYRLRFPDDPVGWEHYGRAYQARQIALVDGDRPPTIDAVTPQAVERREDAETSALLMNFESVGHDCEFGLVQRRFGAEPLGLLRFNAVTYGDLVTAVANRFSRMGDPEVTELITVGNGEYFVRDRRWGLGMHTFVFEGQESADVLYARFCRRLGYLRDKFLGDLADGRKVLVFTCPGLSHDDLVMLHRAFRSLGPVKLLYVAFGMDAGGKSEASAPDGVTDLGNGLFVGRLSRAGRTASGSWDIKFGEWVRVCEQVRDFVAASPRGDGFKATTSVQL